MQATQRQEHTAVRSLLIWAGFGALAVGFSTSMVSAGLFFERLRESAQSSLEHTAEITSNSVAEVLRQAQDVVLQITSQPRARSLLAELNAGTIDADEHRRLASRYLDESLANWPSLRAITRLDTQNRPIAAVGERIPRRYWPDMEASRRGGAVAGPFDIDGAMRLAISVPILDPDGMPLGTDVALFSLEDVTDLLTPVGASGNSYWHLDLFLASGSGENRRFFSAADGESGAFTEFSAEDISRDPDDLSSLMSLDKGFLDIGGYVIAVQDVGIGGLGIFAERPIGELYREVYQDVILSLLLAVLLAGGGTGILLLKLHRFASGLLVQVGDLRTDVASSETRYRDLIDGSIQGILIHRNHKPLLVNKAWAEIHGYSTEEVMELDSVLPLISEGDHRRLAGFSEDRLSGRPAPDRYEYQAVRKTGDLVWVQNIVRPISWKGEPAVQATIFDISERKRREAANANRRQELEAMVRQRTVELAQKNHSLETALAREREYNAMQEQFVSMASHEFRTPLTIISSAAQRIERKAERHSPEELKHRTQKIRNAVQRMVMLIESVLNSAKMDAGKLRIHTSPCRLAKIVEEVCLRQQELSPRHRISVRLDGLPQEIIADGSLLEQVFSNLLSNAVKYAPDSPLIEVRGESDGSEVHISVADRGIGIPAKELPKIFNRFFRASTATGIAGTGIGLNLVAQIVGAHGGDVEVKSVEGRGTIFVVHLPVRPRQPAEDANRAEDNPGVFARMQLHPAGQPSR